jgi:hypothetical protein
MPYPSPAEDEQAKMVRNTFIVASVIIAIGLIFLILVVK